VRCSAILAKEFRKILLTASCLNISRTYTFANSCYEKLNFAIRFWPTWRNPAMLKSKVFSKPFEIMNGKWRTIVTL
jgi:hypothetical protein